MRYIASTLTRSQTYNVYGGLTGTDVMHSITINGGHGLNNRHLVTIEGVLTNVSDDDLSLLQKNELFQYHIKKGFLKITDQTDAMKAVSDLQSRDESAPMTQNDVDNLIDEQVNSRLNGFDVQLDYEGIEKPKKRTRE